MGGTLECARNGACKLLCPLSGNRGQVNVCLRIGSVMQRPTSAATRRPTSAAPPRPSSANPARRSPRAEAFVQLQQRTGHLADTEPVWVADAVGMQQDIAAKTETLNVLQRSAAFKEAQLRSLAEDLATTMHDQPLVEAPDLPMHFLSTVVRRTLLSEDHAAYGDNYSQSARGRPGSAATAAGALSARTSSNLAKSRWMGVGDSRGRPTKVVQYGRSERGGAPPPPEPTSSRTPRIIKTSAEKFVPPSDGEACRAMLPPSLNALVTQLTVQQRFRGGWVRCIGGHHADTINGRSQRCGSH